MLALLPYVVPTRAADVNGRYEIFGVGGKSCGTYNSVRRAKDDWLFQQWLAGYISRTNLHLEETYDIAESTDFEGLRLARESVSRKPDQAIC